MKSTKPGHQFIATEPGNIETLLGKSIKILHGHLLSALWSYGQTCNTLRADKFQRTFARKETVWFWFKFSYSRSLKDPTSGIGIWTKKTPVSSVETRPLCEHWQTVWQTDTHCPVIVTATHTLRPSVGHTTDGTLKGNIWLRWTTRDILI